MGAFLFTVLTHFFLVICLGEVGVVFSRCREIRIKQLSVVWIVRSFLQILREVSINRKWLHKCRSACLSQIVCSPLVLLQLTFVGRLGQVARINRN